MISSFSEANEILDVAAHQILVPAHPLFWLTLAIWRTWADALWLSGS